MNRFPDIPSQDEIDRTTHEDASAGLKAAALVVLGACMGVVLGAIILAAIVTGG